ncbi:undecaprenyl-diphosphate phosphatase [Gammaproteobacteria bacterium]|nr:undecaprenyl-diphosphate phosphatase [Gammaproteobacteria bacterium]
MDFDVFRATFLALIQGLTEFLPISSSAHLILPSALFGWEDQGLAFDVAVHFGTLSAVLMYFRKDVRALLTGCSLHLFRRQASVESRLGWQLLVATIPVVIIGFLLKDYVDLYLRETSVIASTTIIFALLLSFSDRKSSKQGTLAHLPWKSVFIIGFAQVLALVPGTSRSGITMTAALFCNLDRESSSRFSFLLSIPVIAGAALLLTLDLLEQEFVNWSEIVYGMLVAGIAAYFCIYFFLQAINKLGFMPFVIYRLLLGCILFIFFV